MATLPTLVPTSDVTIGGWTGPSGETTDLYARIADIVMGIIRSGTGNTADLIVGLTDVPGDFQSLVSLQYETTLAVGAFSSGEPGGDDNHGLQLTLLDSSNNPVSDVMTVLNRTGGQSGDFFGPTSFTGLTGAAPTRLRITRTFNQNKGNDGHRVWMGSVHLINGTYDPDSEFDLVVADSSHGHAADVAALTQDHDLAVSDPDHASAVDGVVLTQTHGLVVSDASHGHTSEGVDVTHVPTVALAVVDSSHGHVVADLALTLTGYSGGYTSGYGVLAPGGGPLSAVDIAFHLSTTSGSAGNTLASSPAASLGGYIATTTLEDASLHNLFDAVTSEENFVGDIEYRCLFIRNNHETDTWSSVLVWVLSQEPGGADIAISVDTTAASDAGSSTAQAKDVADESTAPSGQTFTNPTTLGTGLSVGDLAPNEVRAIWLRRSVDNAVELLGDGVVLRFSGTVT